jgi:hypothetical protein
MPTPDELLIVWWILLVATSASLTWLIWRDRVQSQKAAIVTTSRGGWRANPGFSRNRPSLVVGLLFLCLLLGCIIGLFVSMWMAHWSALFVLSHFIMMIVFGAVCLGIGAFAWKAFARQAPARRPGWMRVAMIVFGAGLIAFGAYTGIGDFLLTRLQVDGCVTDLAHYASFSRGNFGDHFMITIGESTYTTTHSVYSIVHRGDFVHAEMGAGSKTIFAVEKSKEPSAPTNRCKSI